MEGLSFILKTAYRDSRKNRSRLFLFMSSIILGISALVAINSFNYNLVKDIDSEAKKLLGADLEVEGNKPVNEALLLSLDSIPGEKATELEVFSMSYIPTNDETQFVRIKGLEGNFPYYGELLTAPETARQQYQSKGGALVDDGMMLQHELEIGDSIKLGTQTFAIIGRLKSIFGGVSLGSGFAPTIYISKAALLNTGLIQVGSVVNYKYYFKTPESFDDENWRKNNRKTFRNESFRLESVESQKEDLGEAFSGLNNFLNLVALVSLILGCIGVASSVFIYIKNKIPSIAVFRCLGMKGHQAFQIYFIQIFSLGLLSVIIGALLGSFIQMALPILLRDVLPYEVDMEISWRAILEGISIGFVVTSLFALVPLLAVRLISPLRTLRISFDEDTKPNDPLKWVVYAAIIVSIFIFLYRLTGDILASVFFVIGLLLSFLLLYGVASLIMWFVKKFFPRRWNFVLRQGISNLYRPNNQTRTLIVSIGLGTAILTTLFIIQGLLLNSVSSMEAGNQPNMILYGIETKQKDSLETLTKSLELPLIQQVPIVTMRLSAWKGKTKTAWLADTTRKASRWAINREARVSYRDTLSFDEELVAGKFTGSVNPGDSVFISLDQGYARSLDVDIGDELVWNVQGTRMKTYVGSLRNIEFRSMRTRFFILFPRGVLEQAPQFHVLVTKSPDLATTSNYRREVVKRFPNISVVDLGSILDTLNDILNKISYVIKFMAGFSILTGLIVLISSLFLSKFQRIKESVLLRTIGASTRQILMINAVEYTLLGILSSATGIVIALIAAYLIATQQLEIDFDIQWLPILFVFVFIIGLTVVIGLLNSREVVQKSPLEVLRKELG